MFDSGEFWMSAERMNLLSGAAAVLIEYAPIADALLARNCFNQ
jgi:hypothetical protein